MRSRTELFDLFHKHFSKLSSSHFRSVIGYGSGVLYQTTDEEIIKQKTIDLMIEVPNLHEFHIENYAKNRADYEYLGYYLGPKYYQYSNKQIYPVHFGFFQEKEQKVRYGIVETSTLHNDLISWEDYLFAGRLSKPVVEVEVEKTTKELIKQNYAFALRMGLIKLYLRESVPLNELYEEIVELSYNGDIRRMFNIDKKSHVIVAQGMPYFNEIYRPLIDEMCLERADLFLMDSQENLKITLGEDLSEYLFDAEKLPTIIRPFVEQINIKEIFEEIKFSVKRSSISMMSYNLMSLSPWRVFEYTKKKSK